MRTHTTHARRGGLLLAGVAVAALAGGSAFTAGNTFGETARTPVTGYASTDVTGGTISQLTYNLDATGVNVTNVTLVLAGDTSTSAVSIGFNGGNTTTCGTGTVATDTTYTCTGFSQTTASLTSTAVVIN